jgi:hypothetical protein
MEELEVVQQTTTKVVAVEAQVVFLVTEVLEVVLVLDQMEQAVAAVAEVLQTLDKGMVVAE